MSATRIDQIAADWVARLDAGPLAPAADTELDNWLAQDARHAGAFARARAVFAQADRAVALGSGYDPARFAGATAPAAHRIRRIVLAAAAVLVLSLGAGGGWLLLPDADSYETALGEVRRLPLADGSVMTLNTASKARIAFSADQRSVRLLEGEALFEVVRDPTRPFVVESGDARIRVVGTSFTVRRTSDKGVEVLVRQGHVQMEPSGPAEAPLSLTANMKATAAPGRVARVERVAGEELAQQLTWRDGMIAFSGDTLAAAAEEFSRYSRTRILIDDADVARMQVVGLYAANDPAGFADAVALSFGLSAERRGDEVRLSRRD